MNISIKGLQKTSLIDYPPHIASVVFLGGCNFRCGFCHNPELVLGFDKSKDIDVERVLKQLKGKKKWIDGVCITGGEPTLYPDLYKFIYELKKEGFLVKIDTNGTNPETLQYLIQNKLIDYVAMDIKAPLEKYSEVVGVNVDKEAIQKSVDLIMKSGIIYEFRTTAVPGLLKKEDFLKIGQWLKGSERFCIQQFRNTRALINESLKNVQPYSQKELEEFSDTVRPYFEAIEIKNI
ncbi:anaerobic ribonucleoside-triphosphate reductase activating protein [Candidatus Woesearchaeota archaeon]|nr:anaerobic ribonucleoside-triphosphate reductase activating protein [Candidatus Woesearchaeota archaeon]